ALVASARRAAGEATPATACVLGDAGQGKSHLFRVLVKRLTEMGVDEVLALRAREPALGDADQTLAELLQRVLDLPAVAPADGGRELLRERFGAARRPRSAGRSPLDISLRIGRASAPPVRLRTGNTLRPPAPRATGRSSTMPPPPSPVTAEPPTVPA